MVEDSLILEVEKEIKIAICPRCKQSSHRLHQNHYSLIKDLPWGEQQVVLRVNRRQFKCENCQKPFSEDLDFVKKRQKYTKRYARWILKGSKYLLLKREENLKQEQKEKLLKLKEASVFIRVVHELKEEFTEIFEKSQDLGEGTLKLADWLLKAEAFLPKTVKTIKNWFGQVVGYFERKTTNGMVEGINNRLKVLKRCGFGFKNFENFEKRALLYWHLSNSLA